MLAPGRERTLEVVVRHARDESIELSREIIDARLPAAAARASKKR